MLLIVKIWIAYVLDLIFGDPENILHPVQIIGKIISFCEKRMLSMKNKVFWGGVMTVIVVTITYITCFVIKYNNNIGIFSIIEIYLMYTVFSINSLSREGNKVYNILKKGDINEAREKLSYLVSRDTENMNYNMVIRSVMETISENMVDGIVAPMFYMFIGGLPLAMTYKAINTLDSMVGYRNEKYEQFGKISAKLDDMANFIPARLTGLFICVTSFLLRYNYKNSFKIFLRDRKNHNSPNSAHPESAVAGALGVQFGGEVSYFGDIVYKPTIGDKYKEFEISDIKKNIKIMYVTSLVAIIVFSITSYLIKFIK